MEAIAVYSQRENLFIASLYRQPDNPTHRSTAYELSQALSKIESAIESIQGTPTVMIGGDFSLPTTEWTDGQPQSNGQMKTTLDSFQARLLLTQVVNKATHRSGNILDVVFTNYRQMFNEINCIPTTFSDHFVVEIASHFKSHFAKAQQRSKQFFNKFDEHNFFSDDVQWDNVRQELSTQLFWQNFNQYNECPRVFVLSLKF